MVFPRSRRRERREQELLASEVQRRNRRMLREDVTVFGEELTGLHLETLTDVLDADAQADYRGALDQYERAKTLVKAAEAAEDQLRPVTEALDDGRYLLARVVARRDGLPLPARREPCFFNPQHGPAVADVAWAPSGGVEREVPVCRNDQLRLDRGERPDVRVVRVGDRFVPWWQAGDQGSVRRQRRQALQGAPKYAGVEVGAQQAAAVTQLFG